MVKSGFGLFQCSLGCLLCTLAFLHDLCQKGSIREALQACTLLWIYNGPQVRSTAEFWWFRTDYARTKQWIYSCCEEDFFWNFLQLLAWFLLLIRQLLPAERPHRSTGCRPVSTWCRHTRRGLGWSNCFVTVTLRWEMCTSPFSPSGSHPSHVTANPLV